MNPDLQERLRPEHRGLDRSAILVTGLAAPELTWLRPIASRCAFHGVAGVRWRSGCPIDGPRGRWEQGQLTAYLGRRPPGPGRDARHVLLLAVPLAFSGLFPAQPPPWRPRAAPPVWWLGRGQAPSHLQVTLPAALLEDAIGLTSGRAQADPCTGQGVEGSAGAGWQPQIGPCPGFLQPSSLV